MISKAFLRIAATAAVCGAAAAAVIYPALAQDLPNGKGKETVQMICSGCHDLSPITEGGGGTRDDWEAAVKSMIAMGADIKPDQVTLIADYLGMNFPPKKK
ncbi:MAG TPA: cytochrome c [Micropepsaceae bacterium]|nr:cytochrome c [Micropepsaceae bacterium]